MSELLFHSFENKKLVICSKTDDRIPNPVKIKTMSDMLICSPFAGAVLALLSCFYLISTFFLLFYLLLFPVALPTLPMVLILLSFVGHFHQFASYCPVPIQGFSHIIA